MKVHKAAVAGVVLAGLLGYFNGGASESNFNKTETVQYSESKRVEKNEYFGNGQISYQSVYLDGKLITRRYWNIDGKQTFEIHYNYSKNEDLYEEIIYPNNLCEYIRQKEQYRGSPEGRHKLLRKWFYDEASHKLLLCEHYREGTLIVDKADTFNQNEELEKTFVYYYVPGKEEKRRLKGFDCYNSRGDMISSYTENTTLNIEDIISGRDAKPEQIEEWLRIYRDKTRVPVAIIDSGFDISHPLLTHKMWDNPDEELNGVDDDGNGWVDDDMGWHRHESAWFDISIDSPNINEAIILGIYQIPLSHGTHVASIALKDLDKFALVGFAGDMSHPDYLKKISRFLKDHNILFANMSFGYGNEDDPFAPESASFRALEELIRENSQALIVVAAGNEGMDLDMYGVKSYPPSFSYDNLLVVGALDSDDIVESELPDYEVAYFSSTGDETVDIYAPGRKVPGALIGGGTIPMSGTSMASPYTLNCVLEMYEENPNLNALEIKEIIIKTAYIPKKPLPCVSGGILYPERALSVARLLAKNPLLSIDEAVSQVLNQGK